MSFALYSITSSLHSETAADAAEERFIKDIESELGEKFEHFGEDFSSWGTRPGSIIYIRTGGTEGKFRALGLGGEVRLLTSGQSNSLAASMEILAFLRSKGQKGEIIHGSPKYIAERLRGGLDGGCEAQRFIKPLRDIDLGGIRLGVIGRPSDWLIASDVDYAKAKSRLNAELVDIPMSELLDLLKDSDVDMRSFAGSEAIYDALAQLVRRHRLGGLTLRCFDLLDTVHNTGCLALARLNAEGIPASCEGDIPALLSMAVLQKAKGCPGFQCNLSRIDGDTLLFAHCTAPLTMLSSYRYATHFESGIGTAIKGELHHSEVEIFKIAPDLETYVSIPGRILRNESLPNLCRTQVVVDAPAASAYLLHSPLANHHILSYR